MGLIKDISKQVFDKIEFHRYHKSKNNQAYCVLQNIESYKGRIDKISKKKCDEYAQDVFGWKGFAPWLYVYTLFNGKFKEGWIPDNYYGGVIVPKLKGDYGKVSDLNILTQFLLRDKYCLDIAYFANGSFMDRNHNVIPVADLTNILFSNEEHIVFKQDNSLQGRGVKFFDKETFKYNDIREMGNGVFQSYIQQHEFFNAYTDSSVATIRLTSVIDNHGKVSVRSGYLRLARGADTHVMSCSALKIPINIKNGELYPIGYNSRWEEVNKHPDSCVFFKDKQIPVFNKCVEAVCEFQKRIPFVKCVGWDLIIDQNSNVRLIEWNGEHNDIKFSEATQGPCFSDLNWDKL